MDLLFFSDRSRKTYGESSTEIEYVSNEKKCLGISN